MKLTNTNNHKLIHRAASFLVVGAMVAGSVLPAEAQQQRRTTRRSPRLGTYSRPAQTPVRPAYYTLATDQTLRVRMDEQLSSEYARIGTRFTTTVVDPVYSSGVEVVPAGSKINGRVIDVERAGRRSKAGSISVEFVSIQYPSGASYPINGALTDASGGSVTQDAEGEVSGRSTAKRNAVFIGGGAATGALIGAISGGGKGAGVGAGVGAGLGVAGALFSKGNEAVVKPGTEFGVILNRSVSVPAYKR